MLVKRNTNLILVLVLLFSLFSGTIQSPVKAAEVGNKATVTVIGKDNVSVLSEMEVPFAENATAFDVLRDAVEGDLDAPDTNWGKSINKIKGVEATDPYFWAFSVNGISAQVGSDSYKIQNGDKISFRLKDWNVVSENKVSIKVFGKDNTLLDISNIEFTDQPTAFQLLQVAAGPDQIAYEQYSFGKMITTIKGLKAEGSYYWALYVNDLASTVGAEGYNIQAGDQISFKYESFEVQPPDNDGTPDKEQPTVESVTMTDLQKSIDLVSQYVLKNQVTEWEVVALKKAGKTIPADYLQNVAKQIKAQNGKLPRITDFERYTLGVLAAGGDPTNVGGYNLVEAIYNGNVTRQGINGVAYALIALDSAELKIPQNATWTKEKLLNNLLDNQQIDGGWAWPGTTSSDMDLTAMVLTALAPYKDKENVQSKIELAVNYLSSQYLSSKIDNSNTAAQVIIALSALNIDANGPKFIKNGSSLIKDLFLFQNQENGGFILKNGASVDSMSTYQGFQALVAYQLFLKNEGSLYKLSLSQNPVVIVLEENKLPIQEGKRLPNTATSMYELLAYGLVLIMFGTVLYVMNKRRNA